MNCFIAVAGRSKYAILIMCVAVLSLAAAGCITDSTNPLYTEKDVVEEDILVGGWGDGSQVTSLGNKTYRITWDNKPSASDHDFRVLKLGDHYFVDVENWNHFDKKRQGGHGFFRIAVLGNRVYKRAFSATWLREKLRQTPNDIAHKIDRQIFQPAKDKQSVLEKVTLTAATNDLQSFVLKYVDNPAAYGKVDINDSFPDLEKVCYVKDGKIPIQNSGLASKKYRTFNYWYEVRMSLCSMSFPQNATLNDVATRLDTLSASIKELPILGVDLAASECANDAAKIFASMATIIRDGNDDGKMLEAFVRGLAGDPFGVAKEQIAAQQQAKQQLADCRAKFDRARLVLTDRYEIEFPAIK